MDFDVVIVGAGLVGLSLAAALDRSGLSIALVERDLVDPAAAHAAESDWDARVFAISPGSEAFLRALQGWPADSARVAPVYTMQVFGDRRGSRIEFSAYDAHVAHLATIVENRALLAALWRALEARDDLTALASARCKTVAWQQECAVLALEDGRALRAKLLVAADGADSWLRRAADLETEVTPYAQKAVVANFACELPHRGTAFQWFRADGVLALLPLPGQRVSMVWSAADTVADELLAMDAVTVCTRVSEVSQQVVGALQQITSASAFPLGVIRVNSLVRQRLALVGDAAHNLHPLAGQGVNLGFQDARRLAEVLAQRGACRDVGEVRLLRRYERARREDVLLMTLTTDGLHRLFAHPGGPLGWLRNRGMTLVDHAAPLKRMLVRHAIA